MQKPYEGKDQKKYHFLFLLQAKNAEVRGDQTLVLKGVDPKVLFMTARPGRCRAFVQSEKYLRVWIENNQSFVTYPPQISIIYSGMKENATHKAKALPIELYNPSENGHGNWKFSVKYLPSGTYRDVIFFIDWPAALDCPEPIKLEVPSLLGARHD